MIHAHAPAFDVVGDAYAVAAAFLRRNGLIDDTFTTNSRLLELIIEMVDSGEFNTVVLANRAIVLFQQSELEWIDAPPPIARPSVSAAAPCADPKPST